MADSISSDLRTCAWVNHGCSEYYPVCNVCGETLTCRVHNLDKLSRATTETQPSPTTAKDQPLGFCTKERCWMVVKRVGLLTTGVVAVAVFGKLFRK